MTDRRFQNRRQRRRREGAVMAMGLLFALFGIGLMFCIIGIQQACKYREQMQDASDAAAMSAAHAYANVMNDARSLSEEQWNYIRLAFAYQLQMPPLWKGYTPPDGAPDPVPVGVCTGATPGCLDPGGYIDRALRRADAAGAMLKSRPYFKYLFQKNNNSLLGDAASWSGKAGAPYASLARVSILQGDHSGPTRNRVLRCGTKWDSTTLTWSLQFSDAATAKSITDRAKDAIKKWNDGQSGSSTPIYASPDIPANAKKSLYPAFQSFMSANAPRLKSMCIPQMSRSPDRYRLTALAVSQEPRDRFRNDIDRVFIGAFKSSDEGGGYIDQGDYDGSDLTQFVQAGQYSISQAAFGLTGNAARFRSTKSWQLPDVQFRAALTRDRGLTNSDNVDDDDDDDDAHEWSAIPLHAFGTWTATLVRVHLRWGHEDAARALSNSGGCGGPGGASCKVPERWIGEMIPAMVH